MEKMITITNIYHQSGWSQLIVEEGKAFFCNNQCQPKTYTGQEFVRCDGVEDQGDELIFIGRPDLAGLPIRKTENRHWKGVARVVWIPQSYFEA